jgi:hypothetical protein
MAKLVQSGKKYTKEQLQEAISYWKNKLKALNEADETEEGGKKDDEEEAAEEEDEGGGAVKTVDEDSVEAKAKANPVGDFDLAARMHRLHRGASKKVVTELGKFLNKYKAADNTAIQIENSCDDGDHFEMPAEGDQMVVTIKVDVD